MFYCDPCADKRGWPKSASRWNSMCEICRVLSDCNDIPSIALPMPKQDAPGLSEPFGDKQ